MEGTDSQNWSCIRTRSVYLESAHPIRRRLAPQLLRTTWLWFHYSCLVFLLQQHSESRLNGNVLSFHFVVWILTVACNIYCTEPWWLSTHGMKGRSKILVSTNPTCGHNSLCSCFLLHVPRRVWLWIVKRWHIPSSVDTSTPRQYFSWKKYDHIVPWIDQ